MKASNELILNTVRGVTVETLMHLSKSRQDDILNGMSKLRALEIKCVDENVAKANAKHCDYLSAAVGAVPLGALPSDMSKEELLALNDYAGAKHVG